MYYENKKALTLSMVCAMTFSCLTFFEPAQAEAAFEKNAQQTVADMGLAGISATRSTAIPVLL